MRKSLYIIIFTHVFVVASLADVPTARITDLNRRILEKQAHSKAYEKTEVATQNADKPRVRPTLSERITYLTDGRLSVMIPKGAVIHSPSGTRVAIQDKASGQLVEWNEFFLLNRNALQLHEVSVKQLNGSEIIEQKTMENIRKSKLPTLTTFQNRVVALATNPHTNHTP